MHPSTPAIFYFDFISPFSYLQWRELNDDHADFEIKPVPILFGALLDHHGQLGPAEIEPKKKFSFRFLRWTAERRGIALRFPPAHPFNPLPALRLCVAGGVTRPIVDGIFRHIWAHGKTLESNEEVDALGVALGIDTPLAAIATENVKTQLRTNTAQAIEHNVFGVPTLMINGELFWGMDATAMALEFAAHPDLFDDAEYQRISSLESAISRRKK